MVEIDERLGDRVPTPALRIALDRMIEQPVECPQQVRHKVPYLQFGSQLRGCGRHQADAVPQRLAQRRDGRWIRSSVRELPQRINLFRYPAVRHIQLSE